MTPELRQKVINAINTKLDNSNVGKWDKYWNCCYAKFTFGNNRVAMVHQFFPSRANTSKFAKMHYTISFLANSHNTHYTLEEVAEKLYELGLENTDPFKNGVNTKVLRDLEFKQIELLQEPNIKDIGYYLEEGFYQYKFEIEDNHTYYGTEYSDSNSPYYYGSTYRDVLKKEYLLVRHEDSDNWTRVLYRYVKIGSQCVSNYVGD